MTEGWDGLRDFDPANLKDTQHKQEDLDVAFVRCFETHEGQTVLAYLKRVTIESAVMVSRRGPESRVRTRRAKFYCPRNSKTH
jgi:hypothetical protein